MPLDFIVNGSRTRSSWKKVSPKTWSRHCSARLPKRRGHIGLVNAIGIDPKRESASGRPIPATTARRLVIEFFGVRELAPLFRWKSPTLECSAKAVARSMTPQAAKRRLAAALHRRS
jgi:hypothetical protein